jgi:hypothetical protein
LALIVVDSIGTFEGPGAFGSITDACVLDNGTIVILDESNISICLAGNDGSLLERRSVAGSGPGEFYGVKRVYPNAGGGVWVLAESMERKTVLLDDTMAFVREVVFRDQSLGFPSTFRHLTGDTFAGLFVVHTHPDSSSQAVMLFRNDGSRPMRLRQHSAPYNPIIQGPDFIYTTGDDDVLYVAGANAGIFLVEMFDTQGSLIGGISLPDAYLEPKPPWLIREQTERIERLYLESTGNPMDFSISINEAFSMMDYMGVDSEGRLWVLRGNYLDPVFDVFGTDGNREFVCTVELPAWQDCDRWRFHVGRNGFLAFPENPDLFPVVYRLELAHRE